METRDKMELQKTVLLQESDHMHDNIQRKLGELYKLLVLVFPLITGLFAVAIEGGLAKDVDEALIFSLFAILSNFILVIFNITWMQLSTFTEYKYAEIFPKLYAIAEIEGDNYGQYISRDGTLRTLIAAFVVQGILVTTALSTSYQAIYGNDSPIFIIATNLTTLVAIFTTLACWKVSYDSIISIRKSVVKKNQDTSGEE